MKIKTLIMVIASVVLFGGLSLCTAALAMENFDFRKMNINPEYEERTYSCEAGSARSVHIRQSNSNIIVLPSPDERIHITYFDNETAHYSIVESDIKITVDYSPKKLWYEYLLLTFDFQNHPLTLYLPEKYEGSIDLATSNSEIRINNLDIDGDVMMKTSNGKITASALTVSGGLFADTSNAAVLLTDVKAKGTLHSGTSNGPIELYNVTARDLSSNTSNGRITANGVEAYEIRFDTSNAGIALSEVDVSYKIYCNTSNGRIHGDVAGSMSDFNIKSRTSNAGSSLPRQNSGGSKYMEMYTSNGEINVTFR